MYVIVGVAALIVGFVACAAIQAAKRKSDERELGRAKDQALQIVNDAVREAEARKKESILEAKEEILAARNETENELKERRKEVSRQERRIAQKEETLDNKTEALEQKHTALQKKLDEAEELKRQIGEVLAKQLESLEKYSGLTSEEAKDELLRRVEGEIEHETALRIAEYDARFRDEASERAKDILSQTIQRCAADHVSEVAISVVPLPSEEMKGRIIGREGRNIRTIEQLIGVELIIDDTPEVITISGFDPIRRETARIALERLISDGRIHPARIEE
ncbi:MAG: DUF3552 domain-containing protein, partial [Oscillospiraceae bacterium]|nr:DUF3552 domain-containing protein [Oscillospiraceae bacterium]